MRMMTSTTYQKTRCLLLPHSSVDVVAITFLVIRNSFDFVEDFCEEGSPSPSTALLVAGVRRDYFQVVMGGKPGERNLTASDIPTFGDELAGMAYLPRILAKAKAKLRGELDPDLMYGCGGDRAFLARSGGLHLADFLRQVWAADGDDGKIVTWIHAY